MKYLFYIIVTILYLSYSSTKAQDLLKHEDAVSIALKNNFDILVARNEADISRINNSLGNAGMLPNISISASDDFSINNINQKLSSENEVKSSNVNENSFNASLVLNWTLFDGGKMFITKNKLNEIQALGEIAFKDKVLQTVYSVIIAYYDIVRQKQQLKSINEGIEYNKERVKILQTSFDAGLSPKTNLLQAKIDLNVFSENAINQLSIISSAKRNLNQLLSRNSDITFEVEDSITDNYVPNRTELEQKILTDNTDILALQKQVIISEMSIGEYKSQLYPKIKLNTAYSFFQSDFSSGNILMNRANGPQIGASISIPLFQGGNSNRQISIAKIQLQTNKDNLENVKLIVNSQLQNALTIFENQQRLLVIEKDNSLLTKENLDISMQRLRLGQTTALEVKLAQESYVDSQTRLINFKYNLKVAEVKLKQLISVL